MPSKACTFQIVTIDSVEKSDSKNQERHVDLLMDGWVGVWVDR